MFWPLSIELEQELVLYSTIKPLHDCRRPRNGDTYIAHQTI